MIKEGDTVMCDDLEVYVEEIDTSRDTAYVFDHVNYNGGWVKLAELTEIKQVCILSSGEQ